MKYTPVTDSGRVLYRGNVTVEHRWDDWMAFVTDEPGVWECADTPEKAIEKLLVSRPDIARMEMM